MYIVHTRACLCLCIYTTTLQSHDDFRARNMQVLNTGFIKLHYILRKSRQTLVVVR
jgi:hypothetical protein